MDARMFAGVLGLVAAFSFSVALEAKSAEMVVGDKSVALAETKQMFRREIDAYLRSLNEQLRTTLGEDLKLNLKPRVEFALDESRARG